MGADVANAASLAGQGRVGAPQRLFLSALLQVLRQPILGIFNLHHVDLAQGAAPHQFTRAIMGATAVGVVPMAIAWIGDQVNYSIRQATLARLLEATVSA
ncbi:MAG: hypothetical protein Q7K57_54965 [Burkholderiaceae bacterium]|nr:hypothetical protein [Burkholderiaceae bacterium]